MRKNETLWIPGRLYSEQSSEKIERRSKSGKIYKVCVNNSWIKRESQRSQKAAVKQVWDSKKIVLSLPCKVTLIRCGYGEMDFDAYVYSLKHTRDAIAECILPGMKTGRADGDKRIEWAYKQEKGINGVRIEIEYDTNE